jgi:hypothetical protein
MFLYMYGYVRLQFDVAMLVVRDDSANGLLVLMLPAVCHIRYSSILYFMLLVFG